MNDNNDRAQEEPLPPPRQIANPRRVAELAVVKTILGTVGEVTRDYFASDKLTEKEQPVFNKYTYHGWSPGLWTGLATFGILFGGLRYIDYRRFVKAKALPNSAAFHQKSTISRSQYSALDGKPVLNSATDGNLFAPSAENFKIFSKGVVVQIQFMLCTAIALFMGTMAANAFSDRDKFLRDLSKVPLQSGKSELCAKMCPKLLEQRKLLLSYGSMEPILAAIPRPEKDEVLGRKKKRKLDLLYSTIGTAFNPSELMSDPETEDLENLVQLLQNCQQRMDFEEEFRLRQKQLRTSADGQDEDGYIDGPVDVPEPGVPLHFVRLSDAIDSSTTSNGIDGNNPVVKRAGLWGWWKG
jgi:hypothetical protein